MPLARTRQSLATFIRQVMSRVDYLALYPSVIVKQNADGTLELSPQSPRLADFSNVPFRLGLPGVTVRVKAGGSVLLGFEGGDPSRPFAIDPQATALEEIAITASAEVKVRAPNVSLADGGRPIARQGDPIVIPIGTVLTTATPPPAGAAGPLALPLVGTIGFGNQTVKG